MKLNPLKTHLTGRPEQDPVILRCRMYPRKGKDPRLIHGFVLPGRSQVDMCHLRRVGDHRQDDGEIYASLLHGRRQLIHRTIRKRGRAAVLRQLFQSCLRDLLRKCMHMKIHNPDRIGTILQPLKCNLSPHLLLLQLTVHFLRRREDPRKIML